MAREIDTVLRRMQHKASGGEIWSVTDCSHWRGLVPTAIADSSQGGQSGQKYSTDCDL